MLIGTWKENPCTLGVDKCKYILLPPPENEFHCTKIDMKTFDIRFDIIVLRWVQTTAASISP